jgi:peptidoglycan/xylan/chitin deacetylase (PgdA/CDA1 family)
MDGPALVSLTFDDGLRCQFERAVPILDQHGFSATFFLVANSDPIHERPGWRKINWSEEDNQLLRSMVKRGHEIGAHSVTHRWPELDRDPKGEAEKSKRWIEERLGIEVPSYAYPFCYITPAIKDSVVTAGYKQARGGANGSYYSGQTEIDCFNVDCRQVSSSENVGGWMRPGCWHVLMFHGIGAQNDGWSPIPEAEFAREMAELANHRDRGAVEVVTFKDGADRIRKAI